MSGSLRNSESVLPGASSTATGTAMVTCELAVLPPIQYLADSSDRTCDRRYLGCQRDQSRPRFLHNTLVWFARGQLCFQSFCLLEHFSRLAISECRYVTYRLLMVAVDMLSSLRALAIDIRVYVLSVNVDVTGSTSRCHLLPLLSLQYSPYRFPPFQAIKNGNVRVGIY